MDATTHLPQPDRDAVLELAEAVTAADGVRPLNDDALHGLRRDGERHWLLRDDAGLAGYAQHSPAFGTAQVCVRPDARRRGHGRSLLDAALGAGASGAVSYTHLTLPTSDLV